MKLFLQYFTFLEEGYSSSITKRTRADKVRSTAGTIAVSQAKKKSDPLYKKMMYQKQMYLKTKEQLQRKYKSKALSLARQRASIYKK